jgi:long-chain acyl-CoA synthetase
VRLFRAAFRETVILPLFRHYIPLEIEGTLERIEPPVIFAPNHTSNLDTLAILAALPRSWRRTLAPAVSQDYFLPYLEGTGPIGGRLSLGVQFLLAVTGVNVFPLPQATRGVRDALHFAGELVDSGYSILIFPEGRRTSDGSMHAFRPGVGLMAVRLRIPVVPVHLRGLYEVLPVHESWPKPGPARVRFGAPLSFAENEDYKKATEAIEEAVRRLA